MAGNFLKTHKNLLKNAKTFKQSITDENKDWKTAPVQQSDYLKEFLECIRTEGLEKAYQEYGDNPPGPNPTFIQAAKQAENVYDVIIVGAGMAGISAAYELKKAGLSVLILEQTERYGGRVFTYAGSKYNLSPGIFAEAGAMRLPGKVDDTNDRVHFLTDGYIKDFNLAIQPFSNYDENGLTNIYGLKERTSDWNSLHFDNVWPNWKDGIKGGLVIDNIDVYYEKTTEVVTNQLRLWLNESKDVVNGDIDAWNRWIKIWTQFTLESFLESNIDAILAKLPTNADQEHLDLTTLGNLLPWSNDALRGYSVSSYTEQLDQSLVQYLRDQLGGWWSENMHCLVGGMDTLPNAFFANGILNETDIKFFKQVSKICYSFVNTSPNDDFVTVTCYPTVTGPKTEYNAKAVLVTTPVNILRQITLVPKEGNPATDIPLRKTLQAIEDIFTGPSTKIFLQTKRRFWEVSGINGGFSKTNLPIGQIHYVKPEDNCNEKGLILIYTWKSEAMMFGSLSNDQVKLEVMEQISEIHPEINEAEMVETCIVHAWYNQPSYQGAYGLLKTTQFDNIRYLWEPTLGNVFFAGEALSFTTGWIQGALESGLSSAYQVYQRYKKRTQAQKLS